MWEPCRKFIHPRVRCNSPGFPSQKFILKYISSRLESARARSPRPPTWAWRWLIFVERSPRKPCLSRHIHWEVEPSPRSPSIYIWDLWDGWERDRIQEGTRTNGSRKKSETRGTRVKGICASECESRGEIRRRRERESNEWSEKEGWRGGERRRERSVRGVIGCSLCAQCMGIVMDQL